MRLHMLVAALLGFVLWPGLAQAQKDDKIKLPVDDSRDDKIRFAVDAGVFKEVDPKKDYRHGRVVSFTSGNEDVTGIVVYVRGNKVYVRTEPGMAPRGYPMPKSAVKWVAYDEKRAARDVTYPEIQQIEVVNGKKRSISYITTTLSPGEEEELRRLQNAENEIGRLEDLSAKEDAILETEIAAHAASVRAQELFNTVVDRRINDPYWGRELNDPRWQRVLISDQDFNVFSNGPGLFGGFSGFLGTSGGLNGVNGLTGLNTANALSTLTGTGVSGVNALSALNNVNGFTGINAINALGTLNGLNGLNGFNGINNVNGGGNLNNYPNNWSPKAAGVNAYDARGVYPTNNPPVPVPAPVVRLPVVAKELNTVRERYLTSYRNAVFEQGRLVAVVYVDPADKK